MRTFHLLYLRLLLFLYSSGLVSAAILFEDGFESGTLGPQWTVSTSNDGRATVSTNFSPATGQWHLVLDDAVLDSVYSSATAGFRLNLHNKKNVRLSFKAKSLGNEVDYGGLTPDDVDGLQISFDGGSNWLYVSQTHQFAYVGPDWTTISFLLDDYGYWVGGFKVLPPDVLIRFSEYDNAPAPVDGIAIDDVLVTGEDDQRAFLETIITARENTGPYTGYVVLAYPPTNSLTLTLSATPTNLIWLPPSVEIPAGQTFAGFEYSFPDDSLANLARELVVSADAPGVRSLPQRIYIQDDDAPVLSLSFPAQAREGEYSNAVVTLSRPPDVPVSLFFSVEPYGEIDLVNQMTIEPGTTNVDIPFGVRRDYRLDGNVTVTASVWAQGLDQATAQVTTIDTDTAELSLYLPETLLEGNQTDSASVSLASAMSTDLQVQLTSTNGADVLFPATVTIPAGWTYQFFSVKAINNSLHDGTRLVTIQASTAGLPTTNATIAVRDNDPADYRFSGLTDVMEQGNPVYIAITAVDIQGKDIQGFTEEASLELVLEDGTTQPLSPAIISFSGNGTWQNTVVLPSTQSQSLRLRVTDTGGNAGYSAPFDLLRYLNLPVADLVWDSARGRLYASVPASTSNTNANHVIVIDPSTATVIGGLFVGQDPGRLELTSGGEYLYVVQNSNGAISRIDPTSLTIESSFPVGTEPTVGTLFAGDISTVDGQPDQLVVVQTRRENWPAYNRIAVYDHGVARPGRTPDRPGMTVIARSDLAGRLFSYTTQTTPSTFRGLRVDDTGMVEIGLNTSFDLGSSDLESAQGLVFAENGVVIDGNQMTHRGAFPTNGRVRPDPASGLVYFLEWSGGYRLGSYDPFRFTNVRRFSLPQSIGESRSLIRWGAHGLAIRGRDNVAMFSSRQIVPGDPPAGLVLTAAASSSLVGVGGGLTYSLTVSNQGPNMAKGTILTANLSAGQSIQSITASNGTYLAANNAVRVQMPDLPSGQAETVTLDVVSLSAGALTCSALVTSEAVDSDLADNTSTAWAKVVFESSIDSFHLVRSGANSLIYDAARNRLWATIPATSGAPGAGGLVWIDPLTGAVSEPILLGGSGNSSALALSRNGRYLYVGLSDSGEMLRIDLSSTNSITRIPLGLNQWAQPFVASQIEALDGDGLSVLVVSAGDFKAAVFDGAVRRRNLTDFGSTRRIQPTADPGIFIGYAYPALHRLSVDSSGVSVVQTVNFVLPNSNEIRSAGNLTLSDSGTLLDNRNLTLKANLGTGGAPCLDPTNRRAYLAFGDIIRGFDTLTWRKTGDITPTLHQPDLYPAMCLRWGPDGFAILDGYGNVYIIRSSLVPVPPDSNADGIDDAWEAAYFETLNVNPAADPDGDGLSNFEEYLFATSPTGTNDSPIQISTTIVAGQFALRLVFPRRAGLAPRPYDYATSPDLSQWSISPSATETILSTQTVDGVAMETVEAIISFPEEATGFLRFEWKPL